MNIKRLFGSVLILFLAVLFTVLSSAKVNATHLRAGEIIVERINCQSLTFRITIIAYTDCEPANPVLFGEGILLLGDGSDPDGDGNEGILLPQIPNTSRSDLGDGVCTAQFTYEYTYSSPGIYKVGYVEANRNEGVLNIDNSVGTTFYVETLIDIDPLVGCNNSPKLLIPPIDRACTGVAFFHNPGAFDPDGDSLSFELVTPKKEPDTNVDGYLPLNDRSFYENFETGNENANGRPTFFIDPVTGEVTWNAPGLVGEYNIAFIVKEWRKLGGRYFEIGYVTRDMQIIVEDCDNERPELEIPEDICVEAGTFIDETIFGTDPDNDAVKIEAFSQVFDFGADWTPKDTFQPSVPPAELRFTWQTECLDVREQPYQVVFKITDNPPTGPRLVSFETWNITVVGPKPEITNLQQDGQALSLTWESYACQNAESIQVWRRVESNPYTPDECETGIRENAGYSLINTLDEEAISYRDADLAAAAKYCYRLVAIFPNPQGGESVVSDEICFEFVPAEEPIITHVSVESTDDTSGEVLVVWREPFERGTLVPPFEFKVFRAEGQNSSNFTLIETLNPAPTVDSLGFTSYFHRDTGLNTLDNAYNYQIAVVDPSASGGGEDILSAPASTVRLEPTPLFNQIQLDWSAIVPWSNNIPAPPGSEHLIYRGLEGTPEEELELIAKIDVNQFGFSFTDSVDINDELVYCYRVLTKGTYGNPAIQGPGLRPLFNFSQTVCAQASDSIPPCQPVVSVQGPNCDDFNFCNTSALTFRNTISWTTDFIGECQDDVREYELYFAEQVGAPFELLATVRDTFFIHQKPNSYKGCYQVKAIDRSGNESELSEVFCVDNCPNYILPNVFTPNGDQDNCNETFRAFGSEVSTCGDGVVDTSKCARFVESVRFTVYNRWGSAVFTYTGEQGSENDIFIGWDGKDDDGAELPAGVYYYLAEVIFDVVDPAEAKQDIKGWVQILK